MGEGQTEYRSGAKHSGKPYERISASKFRRELASYIFWVSHHSSGIVHMAGQLVTIAVLFFPGLDGYVCSYYLLRSM